MPSHNVGSLSVAILLFSTPRSIVHCSRGIIRRSSLFLSLQSYHYFPETRSTPVINLGCICVCSQVSVLYSSSSPTIITVKRSTVGSRAFPVAASQTWNSLPEDVTSASTLRSFQQRLKTHLFRQCFSVL